MTEATPKTGFVVYLDGEPVDLNGAIVLRDLEDAMARVPFHAGIMLAKRLSENDPRIATYTYPPFVGEWPFTIHPDGRRSIAVYDMAYEIRHADKSMPVPTGV